MQRFPLLFLAALLPAVHGCTREALSRAGYETLQNIGQQQCEQDLSAGCPERRSYEEYRRAREQAMRPGQD
jgi:hypothetical protein